MLAQVRDARVWDSIRWLYVGAAVLFLINISIGLVNVFSPDTLPRGQMLSHFHAGSIGWVTLSILATAFWTFSGGRDLSDGYGTLVKTLMIVGLVSVAGYIAGFYFAFNDTGWFWMLPVFGIPAALVVLTAFVLVTSQLGKQPVLTTVHLLIFGALLVASLGALMGVLRGLSLGAGINLYPSGPGVDAIGAHAAPMEMYLALALAAIIEAVMPRHDANERWGWAGLVQMLLWVIAAIAASMAFYFGIEALIPLGLLGLVLGFLFYMVRIGWRTFTVPPIHTGANVTVFSAGLLFPVYIGLFVYLVAAYYAQGNFPPHELGVAMVHVTFVGVATNSLFAAHSLFTAESLRSRRLEVWGVAIMNIGLLVFVAGVFAGVRHGALLMAVGVLMALFSSFDRLVNVRQPPAHATLYGEGSLD